VHLALAAIVAVGMWFGKFTRNTEDFFFAGRRFSWWLGGFRSLSIPCGPILADGDSAVLTQAAVDHGNLRTDRPVRVEKIL